MNGMQRQPQVITTNQLILANGTNVNASDILRFNVTSPGGNHSNITEHAVMQEEVNNGSFELNITLAPYIVKNSNSPTGTNIPITTNITATFNEPMNSSTLNSATVIVKNSTSGTIAGDITYNSATKTVTFDPDSSLEYTETYNVTITTGVQDLAGNNMSSNFTWNFTTVTAAQPSPCFIATAAYGTPLHEDIDVLRGFRETNI